MKTKSYIALVLVFASGLIAGLARHHRSAVVAASPVAAGATPPPAVPRMASVRAALAASFDVSALEKRHSAPPARHKQGGKIKGVVSTRDGARLSSATVCCVESVESAVERCVRTDGSGEYELSMLSSDVHGLLASAPGHRSRLEPISGSMDVELRQDLHLDAEPGLRRLRGLVVDGTGGWVTGAIVSARSLDAAEPLATTFTGSEGRFVLDVARGDTVELVAEAEAYSRTSRRVAAPASGLTLVLIPAGEISGRVVQLESQEPVGNIEVTARMGDDLTPRTIRVRSADDGSFHLTALAAGRLELEAQGSRWRSETALIVLGVGQALDGVTLSVSPASILTAEIRRAGAPCPDAFLHVSGAHSGLARPDSSGIVRFPGLLPGRYRVSAGCPSATGTPVNEELVVNLSPIHRIWDLPVDNVEAPEKACCEPAGSIHVEVDAEGIEADALRVWANLSGNPRASMPGQRQGNLTVFDQLSLGRYQVYLDQSPETRAEVTLEHDGQTVRIRLQAPRRTQISGRVLDERGLPLPDAWVKAIPREGRLNEGAVVPVLTDSEGRFAISGLYPTRYDVSVESAVGNALESDVMGGAHELELKVSD